MSRALDRLTDELREQPPLSLPPGTVTMGEPQRQADGSVVIPFVYRVDNAGWQGFREQALRSLATPIEPSRSKGP